jgi:hypothetical protein
MGALATSVKRRPTAFGTSIALLSDVNDIFTADALPWR